jgi:predicted nucleic acid-binding Zn ribbon protein
MPFSPARFALSPDDRADDRADDEPAVAAGPAHDAADPHDPTGLEVARSVARSLRPSTPGRRTAGGGDRASARRPSSPRLSGSRPDARDPALIGDVLDGVIQRSGWAPDVAVRSMFARWSELVGAEVAQHCQPTGFDDGVLKVRADSTAWATQLRLLAASVVRRLNDELGDGSVNVIDVTGPDAPSWSKGRRSVRDGRGPRDTYG